MLQAQACVLQAQACEARVLQAQAHVLQAQVRAKGPDPHGIRVEPLRDIPQLCLLLPQLLLQLLCVGQQEI